MRIYYFSIIAVVKMFDNYYFHKILFGNTRSLQFTLNKIFFIPARYLCYNKYILAYEVPKANVKNLFCRQ